MDIYSKISFESGKLITIRYSTSFSFAVSFLSIDMQNAIYSIYGPVRLADEIVDTFHGHDQRKLLEKFRRDLDDALENKISMNPVLNGFAITCHKYNIKKHLVDSFMKSMEKDLSKSVYSNANELNDYIYGSADVVGLMCLKVFVNGNEQLYNKLENPAMKLGTAFQKVNFLRDLNADINELNRKYFPDFEINNFDDSVKSKIIQNIEEDFDEARKGIKELPGKSKLAVMIAYIYYRHLLKKIKCTPAKKIISQRIRIPNYIKILLIPKAYLKYKLNIV